MSLASLIAFNLALLAAIVSPGPALLTAIQTTLTAGRTAGIAIGCGLGLVAAGWTLAALLGLDVVFELYPGAYVAAKLAGGAYLIYIAWRMWRGAREPVVAARTFRAGHAFARGLLVNLLNPKSVLFAAAVLIVVFPPDMSAADNAVVVGNHLLVEFVFYTAMAFGMSSRAISGRYLRAKPVLDRAAAAILGALGLRLLVSR